MTVTIGRRELLAALGGAAVAWPLGARAQQPGKRVGWLGPGLDYPVQSLGRQVLLAELRKLGFTEGQNLTIEHRPTGEGVAKAFTGANELVAAKVDVILADGPEIALQAATAARPVVPVVMLANNYNPFDRGYVKTLVEPGGNVTGVFYRQQELAAKQIELLVEAFPTRTRLGVLWDSVSEDTFQSAERAAQAMRLSLRPVKLEKPPHDFEAAFRSLAQGESDSVLVLSSPAFTPHRIQIAELAIQHRLPTMFIFKTYVDAGGLMSYGIDPTLTYQRAASYIAKILRGAHPLDLPVEQADKFLFALNLKTAKALGVEVPTSILLRADESGEAARVHLAARRRGGGYGQPNVAYGQAGAWGSLLYPVVAIAFPGLPPEQIINVPTGSVHHGVCRTAAVAFYIGRRQY